MAELDWRQRAVCREHDPDMWFPTPGDKPTRRAAVRICRACPVAVECGREAFAIDAADGIWGGLTSKQRSNLLGVPASARRHATKILSPCGTPAAYQRHYRNGEKPCDACRRAHNAYHSGNVQQRARRNRR